MKKHTKKLLSIGLSAALVAPLVLSNQGLASAVATKVTEGPVTFVAVDDTKGATLSVAGKKVTLVKLDQQTESLTSVTNAWSNTGGEDLSDKGEVAFTDVKAGKYALTLKLDSKTNVTRFLSYTPKAAVTKTSVVVPTLDEAGKLDRKVSGTISGTVTGGTETKLAIVGKDTTWTTIADAKGNFSVALPVGTYDVVIIGKDTESKDDKQNQVYKGIKVIAGQSSTPLDEMNATVDWEENANNLGFTEVKTSNKDNAASTITEFSKEYKGTLNAAGKVSAYTLDKGASDETTDDVYTLIGESVAKADKSGKAAFSIKLLNAQPGKNVVIIAEDEALNRYKKPYEFNEINPAVKADTTKNEIGQPIELTFTDASKSYGVASKLTITAVDTKDPADPEKPEVLKKPIELSEKTSKAANDFSISSGKIIINPSFFIDKFKAKASDYKFVIKGENGFTEQTIDQTISPSKTVAASLTVKAEKGTAIGATKLTLKVSEKNTIKYAVGSVVPTAPTAYSVAPTSTEYESGKDLLGVDSKDKKYVAVYEVNEENQVVKFKALTLTAAQIK